MHAWERSTAGRVRVSSHGANAGCMKLACGPAVAGSGCLAALRGLPRIVNRAEEPHDSRRALLERARGDGASGWSESAVPPRACARAAASDTERDKTAGSCSGRPSHGISCDLRWNGERSATRDLWLTSTAGAGEARDQRCIHSATKSGRSVDTFDSNRGARFSRNARTPSAPSCWLRCHIASESMRCASSGCDCAPLR